MADCHFAVFLDCEWFLICWPLLNLLALLGGLLVVEGVFGVDGLGETLTDLVVDRQGLDALLLANILMVFGLIVFCIEQLPLERILGRR